MAISDQQVLTWLQNNATASDKDIYEAMKIYDVSPEQLSRVTGKPVENIVSRVGQVEQQYPGAVTASEGGVADWQVKKWLQENPDVSDEQIYSAMQIHGVDPTQLSRVTGAPISNIQQRMAPFMPTGQVGFEEAINKGLTNVAKTLGKSQAEVARLYGLNIEDIKAAEDRARGDLQTTFGDALSYFQPYQSAGQTALDRQMALSGALGQDAFQQAYVEDPYTAFLREQGMRANLAGASATGGLGGGNVQKELQRFGQGLAAQGVQQQIQNLGALSGMGLNAAGGAAGVQQGLGTALSGLGMTGAQMVSGQRGALAGEQSQYGANLANIEAQAAAALANQRARTGELLAGQIGTGAINLGNLATAQGTGISQGITSYTDAINAMNQYYANQAAQSAQNLGTAQSNLATGTPFQNQPVMDYGQMISGALGAAGTGYQLGQMFQGQQQPAGPPATYVGPMSRSWPVFDGSYARPNPMANTGQVLTGIPGVQSFNVLQPFAANKTPQSALI